MSNIINVYDLPIVSNVCNQNLREIIKLPKEFPKVSMAHVTMDAGNQSLIHKHYGMKEIYHILSGEGILYCGSKAVRAYDGINVPIFSNTSHKLHNIGNTKLEHLVFAFPPFNPDDVILLNEKDWKKPSNIINSAYNKPMFQAKDGAFVYELDSEKERMTTGAGLAAGFLPEKRTAKQHYHNSSEEIYYIVSGTGNVYLNGKKSWIKTGDAIYVPANTIHGLENTESVRLSVLCITSPPYSDDDFFFA